MHRLRRIASESLAWMALGTFLAIGVPLFVCMPLWVDTTYHDLSARNILQGGVHYRDIFETNLPGMVWLQAAVRSVVGWSSEAIRIVDLLVVGSSVLLLAGYLMKLGLRRDRVVWFAAAACLFYVYETEFIHCQRDSWMLPPTLLALHLRLRQVHNADRRSPARAFGCSLAEGLFWGLAIWIKPHCIVPALLTWLVSLGPLRRKKVPGRALHDFMGLLSGGILAGIGGTVWLMSTGAWMPMWDVLLRWNGEYYQWSMREMDHRLSMVIMYFAPWSLLHLVALPMALFSAVRLLLSRPEHPNYSWRLQRGLISAFYLGWLAEATLLQKSFHYSQAPVMLLAIAVMTAHRWPVPFLFISWVVLGGAVNLHRQEHPESLSFLAEFEAERPNTYHQLIPRTKLFNQAWKQHWSRCLREGSSPELKDVLSFYWLNHCTPGWSDLDRVRQYLGGLNLKDGDLVCWDDSTHPLYLDLNLRPRFRFMHVNTALDFRSKRSIIQDELIASRPRYAVGDLVAGWSLLYNYCSPWRITEDDLHLPEDFPCVAERVFPWNQEIVFRSGRYVVFRVVRPIEGVRMPYSIRSGK